MFSFFLSIDGAFSVCLQILKHAESPAVFVVIRTASFPTDVNAVFVCVLTLN